MHRFSGGKTLQLRELSLYISARNTDPIPMILRLISILSLIVAVALPAAAQDRRVPALSGELRLSYAPVVQKAAPSVVNVYAARLVATQRNPFMEDPFF